MLHRKEPSCRLAFRATVALATSPERRAPLGTISLHPGSLGKWHSPFRRARESDHGGAPTLRAGRGSLISSKPASHAPGGASGRLRPRPVLRVSFRKSCPPTTQFGTAPRSWKCRSKAQNPPVGRSLACHDFANGEQMSRLSSALGACFPNHRLRPRPTRRG
jgi:hypothetical protein